MSTSYTFHWIVLKLEERREALSSRKLNLSAPDSEVEVKYRNLGWFVTIRDPNSNAPDLTWGLGFDKPVGLEVGSPITLTLTLTGGKKL